MPANSGGAAIALSKPRARQNASASAFDSTVNVLARASHLLSRSLGGRSKGSLLVPTHGLAPRANSGLAPRANGLAPVPTGWHPPFVDSAHLAPIGARSVTRFLFGTAW